MRARGCAVWMALLGILAPAQAAAQQEDGRQVFTGTDAVWAAGFVVGTIAVAPLDARLAGALRDSTWQAQPAASFSANGLRLLGFPGSLLVTGGMYVFGRLGGHPAFADMGLHGAGAITLATAVTLGTKSLAGRARPYAAPQDPFDFRLGRGWLDDRYQSLPSGHTTAAFATAAALTAELGERWPDSELLAGTTLFGMATLVGISRLYHDVHWSSDIVLGAGIGTLAGWTVVDYMHSNPDNRLDRWLLGVTISPTPGGQRARLWVTPAFF